MHSVSVNLSNSKLNELDLVTKNATKVTLRLSPSLIDFQGLSK